jgi:molybdopterin molybdotransferase
MLDFDTAQARLAERAIPPSAEDFVPLDALHGRILATDIVAGLDLPPADNSAMDGYAVRSADVTSAGTVLPIQQRCFAGQAPESLRAGHAIRLFTGSIMPEGADAVLMQEDCVEADNRVTLGRVPRAGAYVRAKGEDMACGQTVLRRGTLLEAPQIAVLAAQGFARAPVFPRLSVGILTTGDELMRPGEPLRAAAIYDSNGPMLASLCRELGTAPPPRSATSTTMPQRSNRPWPNWPAPAIWCSASGAPPSAKRTWSSPRSKRWAAHWTCGAYA